MLNQDPQDIYHSVHKHTLEWAYTIFRHFTLLTLLNTHTHMHTLFPRYAVNYSSGTAFDSADLPCIETKPKHHIEIYIHKPPPPPHFFRHFIMLYDFRPSGWKMTIILLQQLAIKTLAEYVECVWRSRSGAHRENYSHRVSIRHTLTHTLKRRVMQQASWTMAGARDGWSFGESSEKYQSKQTNAF